jgi:hypothetical protein
MSHDFEIRVGNIHEWIPFATRNREFLDEFANLSKTLHEMFIRQLHTPHERIDMFVFAVGRMVVDDFMEILVLCGNAEANGAQKILRGMFERVVTMLYLQQNPDQLQAYYDFFWVTERRLVNAIEATFRKGAVDPERAARVEAEYQRVKGTFQKKVCDMCGATVDNFTWTKIDTVEMAKRVGLAGFIVPAYYLPLGHAHATMTGILDRLETTPEDGLTFGARLNPLMADRVLSAAHSLLLYALAAQVDQFKLDPAPVERLKADVVRIWMNRRDLAAEEPAAASPAADAPPPPRR